MIAQVSDLGDHRWRCRESNPGPPSLHEGFSVRSPLCLYSDPPVMRTSRCDDPSRCLVFPPTPRPGGRVSPLADAGHRSGDIPGPTASYWVRQRARRSDCVVSEGVLLISGTCFFATHGLRGHRRLPRHASPRSDSGVETVHPLAPPVRRLHHGNACGPADHPGSTWRCSRSTARAERRGNRHRSSRTRPFAARP